MQRIANKPVKTARQIGSELATTYLSGTRWISAALLVLGSATLSWGQCWGWIGTQVNLGPSPQAVAIADFNGDGKRDVAVTDYVTNELKIRFGTGDGKFSGGNTNAVGYGPTAIAVGYLNADNKPDIATANRENHTVSILLNNGSGGFLPAVTKIVGLNPSSVAMGDFNSDGKTDVVVANGSSNSISLLLNKGNGTFSAPSFFKTDKSPTSLIARDLNGDGKTDVAVTNFISNTVMLMIGTGVGNFVATPTYTVGKGPISLAARDVDNDGKIDLVTANMLASTVSVLLNNGSTGWLPFSQPIDYPTVGIPSAVAIGDFNNDGSQDLAVASRNLDRVQLMQNGGNGNFTLAGKSDVTSPSGVAIGYIDSDTHLDIVLPCHSDLSYSWIYILRQGCGELARRGVEMPGSTGNSTATIIQTDDVTGLETTLGATVSPNPVEDELQVRIDGASGQAVRLWLVDGQGRTVVDRKVQVDENHHRESIPVTQTTAGLYLL
ncbi:MAG: VCBS repeat-containing protein, partial [Cytophagaceae bacterium]